MTLKEMKLIEDGVVRLTQAVAAAMETAPVLGCFYVELKLTNSRKEWWQFIDALKLNFSKAYNEKWNGRVAPLDPFKYFVVKRNGRGNQTLYCFYLFFNAEPLYNQPQLTDEMIANDIGQIVRVSLTPSKRKLLPLSSSPHYFAFPRYTQAMSAGLKQLIVHAQPLLKDKFEPTILGEKRITQTKQRRFFSRATTEQCLHWFNRLNRTDTPYYHEGKLIVNYREKKRCKRFVIQTLDEIYSSLDAIMLFTNHQTVVPENLTLSLEKENNV